MRCTDCAKFVSMEPSDPEVELDASWDAELKLAAVDGHIRLSLVCANCGTELKENVFDVVDVDVKIDHKEECGDKTKGSPLLSVEFDVNVDDFYVPPNRKVQKHMYAITANIKVSCDDCGATGTAEFKDEVQSSHMEELQ